VTGKTRANLPGPEGDQESPPRKKEYSTVLVDNIEDGNRSGFVVGGIDLGRLPQVFQFKAHGDVDVAVTKSSVDETEDREMQKRQEMAAQDMSGEASSARATAPIFEVMANMVTPLKETPPHQNQRPSPAILR
jgi:hypothetical protein